MYSSRGPSTSRKPRPPNVALPVDADDYLVPSPQSPPPATPNTINNNMKMHINPYMDLISDNSSSKGMFIYPPPHGYYPGIERALALFMLCCHCCESGSGTFLGSGSGKIEIIDNQNLTSFYAKLYRKFGGMSMLFVKIFIFIQFRCDSYGLA